MQFQENWEIWKTEEGNKALLSILSDLKIKHIPTVFLQVQLYLKIQSIIKAKKISLGLIQSTDSKGTNAEANIDNQYPDIFNGIQKLPMESKPESCN